MPSGNITFSQFQNKFYKDHYTFKQGNNKSIIQPQAQPQILRNKSPNREGSTPEKFCSLTERLSRICEQFNQNQVIDVSIFRKYIAYAKRNIHP